MTKEVGRPRGWCLDRIDFVDPGTLCDAGCKNVLTQAHVVIEGGKQFLYGRRCILKKFGDDKAAYREAIALCPNVTRRAVLSSERGEARANGRGDGEARVSAEAEARFAAEYLWLRMEAFHALCPQIATHPDVRWEALLGPFERRRATGKLERPDIRMILNTEEGARAKRMTWLLHDNLLNLYTVLRQMDQLNPKKTFRIFNSLRFDIGKNHYLTRPQVELAIKYGVRIRSDAFAWAEARGGSDPKERYQ